MEHFPQPSPILILMCAHCSRESGFVGEHTRPENNYNNNNTIIAFNESAGEPLINFLVEVAVVAVATACSVAVEELVGWRRWSSMLSY